MTRLAPPPLNIFSGSPDPLGAALTNPTELARAKGKLTRVYWIEFKNRRWPDVEAAYHMLATGDASSDDDLMAELICAKFRQHPDLRLKVLQAGGAEFLARCTHWTGARTPPAQAWEGEGLTSRFIRNLLEGFRRAESGAVTQERQYSMF